MTRQRRITCKCRSCQQDHLEDVRGLAPSRYRDMQQNYICRQCRDALNAQAASAYPEGVVGWPDAPTGLGSSLAVVLRRALG